MKKRTCRCEVMALMEHKKDCCLGEAFILEQPGNGIRVNIFSINRQRAFFVRSEENERRQS
jgi:hypothetical protein